MHSETREVDFNLNLNSNFNTYNNNQSPITAPHNIMYNPTKLIMICLEQLKELYIYDENRNVKEVENFEERRREIWRAMACPTNYLWQPRADDVPVRKVLPDLRLLLVQ